MRFKQENRSAIAGIDLMPDVFKKLLFYQTYKTPK